MFLLWLLFLRNVYAKTPKQATFPSFQLCIQIKKISVYQVNELHLVYLPEKKKTVFFPLIIKTDDF